MTNTDLTDAVGGFTKTYDRTLEPGFDLIFGSPLYDFTSGYRREETWDTAHLSDDGRITTDFIYSRFNLTPQALPSLNLQYDRQERYDHLEVRVDDISNESYSIGSAYELPSRDVRFKYTINWANITLRTPVDITTNKNVNENFNTTYAIGYNGSAWRRKIDYVINYRGNYSRNKNEQYLNQTGETVLVERIPYRNGLYSTCDGFLPNGTPESVTSCVLNVEDALINNDTETEIPEINLSDPAKVNKNNIGVGLFTTDGAVDTIYVYYGVDGLAAAITWDVYSSNDNENWTFVAQTTASPVLDTETQDFRYEIEFPSTLATFFKVVNTNRVPDVTPITPAGAPPRPVIVTEIEAYGTEVADADVLSNVSKVFIQGLNLAAKLRARADLTFSFHYILDRNDQNPLSVADSVGGFFENIFSNSLDTDDEGFGSDVTRNYGASGTWLTHRLLTTTLRFLRSESWDNSDVRDVRSDTFDLTFNSVPLPTLETRLSLIRNNSYNFGNKDSTTDNALVSVVTKLYRDVNMITDAGYNRSESFVSNQTTKTPFINGTVDAVLTRTLSGTLTYGFRWSDTDGRSSDSKDGSVTLTYRPGRFININGNLRVADFDGDITSTVGGEVDWLPLRALRVNMSYQYTDSDVGPVKIDNVGSYVIWYVTKFADIRVNYSYIRQREDIETEIYNLNTHINCRF
jgi:hypothetical protein